MDCWAEWFIYPASIYQRRKHAREFFINLLTLFSRLVIVRCMSATFQNTETLTYETLSCGVCGVWFALTNDMHRRMLEEGVHCHCPNGHNIAYTKTEVQKLKAELENKERELRAEKCARLAEVNKREAAEKAKFKAERKLKRVHAGVCPECNRTFQSLSRHMASRHKH